MEEEIEIMLIFVTLNDKFLLKLYECRVDRIWKNG
jgi:hypothetical protein